MGRGIETKETVWLLPLASQICFSLILLTGRICPTHRFHTLVWRVVPSMEILTYDQIYEAPEQWYDILDETRFSCSLILGACGHCSAATHCSLAAPCCFFWRGEEEDFPFSLLSRKMVSSHPTNPESRALNIPASSLGSARQKLWQNKHFCNCPRAHCHGWQVKMQWAFQKRSWEPAWKWKTSVAKKILHCFCLEEVVTDPIGSFKSVYTILPDICHSKWPSHFKFT